MTKHWAWMVMAAAAGACGDDRDAVPDRDAAVEAALTVVGGEADLALFALDDALAPGQVVEVLDTELEGTRQVMVADEPVWLVFADLSPGSKWAHRAKILLVHADDGAIDVHDVAWWPILDGVDLWRDTASRTSDQQAVPRRPALPGAVGTVPAYCTADAIQRWALVISAADDAANPKEESQALALELTSRGYRTQNLAPASITNGMATIEAELMRIRTQMVAAPDLGYCDEVTVIWSGHGGQRADGSMRLELDGPAPADRQYVTPARFAAAVAATTEMIEGVQVRVVIDTCFSGGAIDAFFAAMPVDPNANDPMDIVRDVLIVSSSASDETAAGASSPADTFTTDLTDCIRDASAVDWTTLFDCAQADSILTDPQSRAWWATGR